MVCLSIYCTIVLQRQIRVKSALEHLLQQYYYVSNNKVESVKGHWRKSSGLGEGGQLVPPKL